MLFEFLDEPIQRDSVLSELTFKPDIEPNASNKYRVLENEDCEPSKIIVVSSAYCEILHSDPEIMIP